MSDASAAGILVMRAFYALNVVGAGSTGLQLLLKDGKGVEDFWGPQPTTPIPPLAAHLIGSTWMGFALTSIGGLVAPVAFSHVLLAQAIYKGIFFLRSTLPGLLRLRHGQPSGLQKIHLAFAPYALVLPFVLPYAHLFKGLKK